MTSMPAGETTDQTPGGEVAVQPGTVRVACVGFGPGDPRLLTLAGVDALRAADLVLADDEGLVSGVRDERLRVPEPVEVRTIVATTPAARVDEVLRAASEGRRVVRVFRGDPFWDASARAEVSEALARGLEVDVVPGLSQQQVAAEYAGVDLAAAPVQFVRLDPATSSSAAWDHDATVVVATTAAGAAEVVSRAQQSGRRADAPVVATLCGASTSQLTIRCALDALVAALPADTGDADPLIVVLGPAAEVDPAPWFESKPLFGWRVLVPRTKEQSAALISRLDAHGAHPEEVPTIAVEAPRQPQLVDRAIRGLVEGSYEWIVFTSMNAVKAVRTRIEEYGLDARVFSGVRVAVVGNATRGALLEWGITPDLMPEGEHSAAGLAAEFPAFDDLLDPINRVLLPRADIAVETLVSGLTDLGWDVEDVTAYRTVRALPPPAPTREAIKTGDFDAVVFTSSSTVRNLVGIAGKPHACTIIAAIGSRTADTCREHGLRVDVQASRPDVAVLADELADFAALRRAAQLADGKPVKKP